VWTHADFYVWENYGIEKWFDLHFTDTLNATHSNAPIHVSPALGHPFHYSESIGHPVSMTQWGTLVDSTVDPAKVGSQHLTPVWPVITAWGNSNASDNRRINTPEEISCLVKLTILHETKGVMYFPVFSLSAIETGLTDENLTPFDARYEEYVYQRQHDMYNSPDSLRPFNPNECIRDPFRRLGVRPDPDTLGARGWETFYDWKYEPYGRNFRNLGRVHAPIHRMKDKFLDLWDADSCVATIDEPDSCAEIITFTDDPEGGLGDDSRVAMFFVSKDFWNGDTANYGERNFFVTVERSQLPSRFQAPSGSCRALDIEERRLRPWHADSVDAWCKLKVPLTSGQGKLIELVTGSEVRDFTVADPDIYFKHHPDTSQPDSVRYLLGTFPEDEDFVVGDTVSLCAKIFNIGFTSADSVTVIFYEGDPRDTIIEIGHVNVPLPALSGYDSSMAIAHLDWELKAGTSLGAHDIHVVVNHQYEYRDQGQSVRYFLSEADSSNNHAHSLLYVYPRDYATEKLNDPWDMDGDSTTIWQTSDIDTVTGGVYDLPDSIGGVSELQIAGIYEPDSTMHVYLDLGGQGYYIVPDSFSIFSARIFVDKSCTLQVFWYDDYDEEERTPTFPDEIVLEANEWNLVEQDLTESPSEWLDTSYVTRFGFVLTGYGTTFARVSWVKLTKE
jgi:hypothetical protein